jgi:hypothetical protein
MSKPLNYKTSITSTAGLQIKDLMSLNAKALDINLDEERWLVGLNFWQHRQLCLKLRKLQNENKLNTEKI